MPRWVKVFVFIVIFLIVLFVVLKLTGIGGDHGPGRHAAGMLGGFALLAVRRGPEGPAHVGGPVADDVALSESSHG